MKIFILSLIICFIDSCASEICESKLCLLDANRLLNAGTTNTTVKPCDDFKEFSMGNFINFRALHDRYDRIGFLYDVLAAHHERQRKMLLAPIRDGESFVHKIAKNFFQKCISSGRQKIHCLNICEKKIRGLIAYVKGFFI